MRIAAEPCDLLIAHGVILTADAAGRVYRDGAVAIRGGRIVAVDDSSALQSRFAATETIDARDGLVHPGFIDAHIHVSQYTSRSVLPLMAGTSVTMGDWKAALTPEDEHASARLAAVDYLRAGYTGFVDPGTIFAPDAVAAVADEIGIRIWLTDPYVADHAEVLAEHEPDLVSPGFISRWPASTADALARLGGQLHRNREPDGLVRGFIGLYGAATASDALMDAALAVAKANGVQFQEHRGYNPTVVRRDEQLAGRTMTQRLHDAGRLGSFTTFTHMNVVHAGDIELLADSGTRVIWCPFAQMRAIGAGPAEPRMVALARAGVPVALATDIPRTVNFDALGSLAMANAVVCGETLSAMDILRMRTLRAAASVGADREVGSLEVGKRADIVVRPVASSEALGLDAASEAAVVGVTRPPALTLVNGVAVVREGRVLRAEPEAVAEAARRSARALMTKAGLAG